MLMYRLNIWSARGRIERGVERDRADALECIHAAGILATGLHGGKARAEMAGLLNAGGERSVMRAKSRALSDGTAARLRDANVHLKEAWLLLSSAGAREAVAHVRKGLRLARLHSGR
jgi:hypothetical protein